MERNMRIEANLISRLDRLPLNRDLWIVLSMLTWVWIIEAFDVGIIGQVLVVLKQIWPLSPGEIGMLGASSTAGVVIGTASAGYFTNRYGRRRIMLLGMFIFTFFTLIGAFYENLTWIIVMRFLSGLGAGVVFPQPYLMISEIAPSRYRGVLIGICNAILTFAFMLPTACGSWAINNYSLDSAWRVPFIVGGLPIVTLALLWKLMPESPRWLMMRGRYDEVKRLVERFEKRSGVEHDDDFVDQDVFETLNAGRKRDGTGKPSWTNLFRKPYLSRTLVTWSLYTVGLINCYVIMVYLPSIIATTYGMGLSTSVNMVGMLMVIAGVGGFTIGPVADRFGRKIAITIYIGITVACLFLLPSLESRMLTFIVGAAIAFFSIGANAIFKIYIAEQYPTELRAFGTGLGETAARFVGGVLATYYLAFFLEIGGVSSVFIFLAVCYVVAIACMWIWGKETARQNVETASS